MDFKHIPQAIADGNYRLDVSWKNLPKHLALWSEDEPKLRLDLDPDYQRGHVWSQEQRIAYVEAKLQGLVTHDILRFNCPGWMGDFRGPMELVDGKQRMTSALMFLQDEVPVFGRLFSEFTGRLSFWTSFTLTVNTLPTRKEVLEWYLQLNGGGTPHSDEELDRVRALLQAEVS